MATKAVATKGKTKTKKPAARKKPAKATKPVAVPEHFVAPNWGNVLAATPELVPTGDAAVDEALKKIFAGDDSESVYEVAARATTAALIQNYRGVALDNVTVYWNDDVVGTLSPGDKRKQKKVYWAAEWAKNARERMFLWFSQQLAKTAEGREYLLQLAAGDGAARMRGFAASALRQSKPDMAMMRAIADALDPARWVDEITNETSTYLGHTYTVGAMCRVAIDPVAAFTHLSPLLRRVDDHLEAIRVAAVCWGIKFAIEEFGVDPKACERFVPALCELLAGDETQHFALHALRVLPASPAVAEAAQRMLGPSVTEVVYWDRDALELLATSSDPKWLPWLAAALSASWMNWPAAFNGFAAIGDPVGAAVMEKWLAANAAPDRTEAARPIFESIRARGGEITDEHRAVADGFTTSKKDKKKR